MSMGPSAGLLPYCLVLQHSAWRRKCLELWNRLKSRDENNQILCQYWTNALGLEYIDRHVLFANLGTDSLVPERKSLKGGRACVNAGDPAGVDYSLCKSHLQPEASCHPGACGHIVMVTGEQLCVGSRFPGSSREETLPVLLPVSLEIRSITTRRFYGSICPCTAWITLKGGQIKQNNTSRKEQKRFVF